MNTRKKIFASRRLRKLPERTWVVALLVAIIAAAPLLFAGCGGCQKEQPVPPPAGKLSPKPMAEFPHLLEQLEQAKTPEERGFDQMPQGSDSPGKRVVQMLGSPETWDPYGTPALRKALIARWRKRWANEGETMLRGLRQDAPSPGRVEVQAGDIHFARDAGTMRSPFLLNNSRILELDAMDGAFPPSGFMLGDQSGVWAGPLKALDGFAFVVRETGKPARRLDDSQHFTHDFASCTFDYATPDWVFSRTDFPASGQPSLFTCLTLTNRTAEERAIEVDFVADINVRPDWRTDAQNKQQNDLDIIEQRDGLVRAWDPRLPGSMVVLGAAQAADEVKVEDAQATFTYHLKVPPGGTVRLECLIQAGLELNDPNWVGGFRKLATRSEEELAGQKQRVTGAIESGIRFTCSDQRLTEAFVFAKANLGLLTADCRPHFPDVYLMAGVPVFPRLFACDSCISLAGVTAAGFWPEARGTLACLADQARKHQSLVPHESATDATLIGPSNSQETTQFIAACADYLRWTGDRKFAAELYPLLVDAMVAHRKKFVLAQYPEGNGLIEIQGMGSRKLDAVCWQYAALASLAELAAVLGKNDDSTKWRTESTGLRGAIRRDWWMPDRKIWADSLEASGLPKFDGLWSVVFPLLTDIGTAEQSALTLDGLESGWINQWGGVHTREADISQQGSGVVTTGVFAQAAFAHRRPELGLRLLRLNAEAPRQERMPGAFTEMIPPGGSDFVQLWSMGPFLAAIVEGLGGVHPDAFEHRVEISPQLPAGLDWVTLEHVRIGEHELQLDIRLEQQKVVTSLRHVKGPVPLSIVFVPPEQTAGILVDGKLTEPELERFERLDREVKVVKFSLAAGNTVRVTAQ